MSTGISAGRFLSSPVPDLYPDSTLCGPNRDPGERRKDWKLTKSVC
jgi:hypothetical protein